MSNLTKFPSLSYDLPGCVIYMRGGSGVIATTDEEVFPLAKLARRFLKKQQEPEAPRIGKGIKDVAGAMESCFDSYLGMRETFLKSIYDVARSICPFKQGDSVTFLEPYRPRRFTAMEVTQVCAFLAEDGALGWALIGRPYLKNGSLWDMRLIALESDIKPRTSKITPDMV